MRLIEKQGDLFQLPNDYILMHCISADFAMGAGIATKFRDMGIKDFLKKALPNYEQEWDDGTCLSTNIQRQVLNLVTKRHYWEKPTYNSLQAALYSAYAHIDGIAQCKKIVKIGMPRIGCGLDGLDWDKVRPMIIDIFDDLDNVEITVCYL